jgi:hypothetical protein
MKDLNEKLAEVCGYERNGNYWAKGGTVYYLQHDDEYASISGCNMWNPTADLKQLRECYLAAEKDTPDFQGRFYVELCFGLATVANTAKDLATAWVKHPDLVAQAILKAKGVV